MSVSNNKKHLLKFGFCTESVDGYLLRGTLTAEEFAINPSQKPKPFYAQTMIFVPDSLDYWAIPMELNGEAIHGCVHRSTIAEWTDGLVVIKEKMNYCVTYHCKDSYRKNSIEKTVADKKIEGGN